MKSAKVSQKALLRATAAVLAPLLASPSPTSAIIQTDNYTDTTSGQDWNNGSHWSAGIVPGTGYTVGITAAPASLFTVVYDDNYTSATAIYSLTIDGSTTEGVELIQTLTADNLYSGSEIIGNSGIGSYNQTAATNSISGILTLGSGAGSMGTYNLSGGSLAAGTEIIANAATGSSGNPGGNFIQSGGANSVTSTLTLGNASGSYGAYSLSGTGNLAVAGTEYVGCSGAGTFSQSGGTHAVTGNLYLGYSTGSTGLYSLSNGSLTAGNLNVADGGPGTFIQSGGTATVSGAVYLGDFDTGYYSLSSLGVLMAGSEVVGAYGAGTFSQSGGTNSCSGTVSVYGYSSYLLSGGSFSTTTFSVGSYYGGNASQNGGTATVTSLGVGSGFEDYGAYTLSGGSLSAGSEIVGDGGGGGTFSQSGGTNAVSGFLITSNSEAYGVYILSGTGVLTVTGAEYVGNAGYAQGTFIQSGGTHTSSTQLYLGYSAGTTGLYALSSGTLNSRQLSVGYNGTGNFTQSGGTHAITNFLNIGDQSGSSGIYQLSGGTISGSPDFNVGVAGNGSFIQSGGTAHFFELQMGGDSGASGTYSLSSTGSLIAAGSGAYAGSEQIGVNGSATFAQSGGTHTAGSIDLAYSSGSSGTYLLSGGSFSSTGIDMGFGGAAVFNQSGGTQSITGLLNVGTSSNGISGFYGGSALYTLSGGSLSAGTESIGSAYETYTPGTFIQSGGTNATSSLAIGSVGPGSYSLSGTGIVNVTGGVVLGASGGNQSGILSISGGSMSVASLTVWNTPGTSLSLSGGSLNVGSLNLNGTPSLLDWTGGTLNFTQPTTINSNFALGYSFALSSGMTMLANSTLTNNGQITLNGGALGGTGSLVNQMGEINGNGTIGGSGGFTNSDEVAVSGGALILSNTGAISNTGEIDLAVGNQLQLAGGALANTGTINLNGGTITGSAQLNNNSSGVISGNGTISVPLVNSGAISLSTGTLNLPAFTNSGVIEPTGAVANVTGGAIINLSEIQGSGNIANAITNDGIIQPTGNGTLRLSGIVTNPVTGTITVASGNDLILSQGLATNAGLISLAGGMLDTNNIAMGNTGTLSGYGILRTGGLTNNSNIVLAGGTATIDGNVVNNSGGTITVQSGTALFNGLVTNNGTFTAASGGSAVFVSGYSGGAIINDGAVALDANSVSGDIRGTGTLAVGQTGLPVVGQISTGSGVSTMSEPTIAAGSQLDLTDNDLIVHNGNLQQIQSLVDAGYHGDTENGSGIITSTGIAADRTLGVLLNNNGSGSPIYTTFDGQAVMDTDVLVKYTLYGDANLDGKVDAADFVLLSNNFGKTGTTWSQGDFNDDGTTNAADFVLLSNNFGQNLSSSAMQYMDASEIASYNQIATDYGFSPSQIAAWDVKLSGVPEPGSLALVAMGAAAMLRRQRLRPHQ